MTEDDWVIRLVLAFFALCGIGFVYVVIAAAVGSHVDKECLSLGYPSTSLTWDFKPYCIKRVDQTDVVVSLDSARALRRIGR